MKRPNPTQPLIMEMTGGDNHLLSCIHNGLQEVDFSKFYTVLNLKELLAFAAGSWVKRKENINGFTNMLYSNNVYTIFSNVYKRGMPLINSHEAITSKQEKKYQKLNPFGKDLEQRLGQISEKDVTKLVQSLEKPTIKHVFEINYNKGENRNYEQDIMHFQNKYPKKGVNEKKYAAEIAKMISKFPQEYLTIGSKPTTQKKVKPKPPTKASQKEDEQLTIL